MPVERFCIRCRYRLKGLMEDRCPECGQEYNPDDPLSYSISGFKLHPMHSFIGALAMLLVMFWCIADGYSYDAFNGLDAFIDLPSLVFVGGVVIAGLWMCFGPTASLKALATPFTALRFLDPGRIRTNLAVLSRGYQLAWAAGLAGILLNLVLYLRSMDDPAAIGPAVAMSLISPLYGLILAEFIFSPLQQLLISRTNVELPIEIQLVMPKRSVFVLFFGAVLLISLLVWSFVAH